MNLCYDIETNGLLNELTTIWIICTTDLDTGEEKFFSDLDPEADGTIDEGLDYLFSAKRIVAHNQIGFDLLAIRKVKGKEYTGSVTDTLILSQVLNYRRFPGNRHSLALWGEFFGVKKPEHEDWSQYSPEMKHRCREDVKINVLTYNYLIKELESRKNKESLKLGLAAEHAASTFSADCGYYGWPMDLAKMHEVKAQLDAEMKEIEEYINPQLKLKVVQVDKEPEWKEPVFVRSGHYAARTCGWFGVDPAEGLQEDDWKRPIAGDYCRVEVVHPDIGSMESVKLLLIENGWKPDEWNWVTDKKTGKLVRSTPKLTDSSLAPLGRLGEALSKYYTLRARRSILEGWLEAINPETGRLHGDIFVIGTPTFRARHSVIANIPSVDAAYGPEFRSFFSCPPGFKIVGADSSGNQLRGLAHYVGDPKYTKEIVGGDIHTFNKVIIESVYGNLGDIGRRIAKTFIYAWLYAGGDGKLGSIVSGIRDAVLGRRLRDAFSNKVPGIKRLIEKVEKQYSASYKATGKGYIAGLDGRPVYCEGVRLALNYLLQSCEKITCSAAIYWSAREMKRQGIWYQPLIFYHDEVQVMVREEDAERAAVIWKEGFREGPKLFGVTIMDGESKVGTNWNETH